VRKKSPDMIHIFTPLYNGPPAGTVSGGISSSISGPGLFVFHPADERVKRFIFR